MVDTRPTPVPGLPFNPVPEPEDDPPPLTLRITPKPKPKPVEPEPPKVANTRTIGAEHQGPRRHAAVEIRVDGRVITSKLFPYLISVQVIDSLEGGHSECHIELDDRNAELQIPPDDVQLIVAMGWAGEGPRLADTGRSSDAGGQGEQKDDSTVKELPWGGPGIKQIFNGFVSSCESGFGRRGGGRRLWIEATSGNVKGLAKETVTDTLGEGKPDPYVGAGTGGTPDTNTGTVGDKPGEQVPLEEFMKKIFKGTDIEVKLSPEMKKITRDVWSIQNQSPQAWAQSLAQELGGVFKLENGIASLVGRYEGVNVDGDEMPTIEATWGINLIGWRIKPYVGRSQWGAAAARTFNHRTGEWERVLSGIAASGPFGGTDAIANMIHAVADEGQAKQQNTGTETYSKSRRGTGWVLINGEPEAHSGGFVKVLDARPGVDGKYLITESEHNYQRGVGYTTRLNVQYPEPLTDGYGWFQDPGKYDPKKPKEPVQAPKGEPLEPPPAEYKNATPAQKEALRDYYRSLGQPIPRWLLQSNDPGGPGWVPQVPQSR